MFKKSLPKIFFIVILVIVAAHFLLLLPLRWLPPISSAFMLRDQLAGIETQYDWVSLDNISPNLMLAVIAAEDQKFLDHYGFDFDSIKNALQDKGRKRGASTISQQVVKNLYLWPGKSYFRKGLEAYLTVLVELFWSKRRILEVYLNIAEFGRGVYGAGAASQQFFNKSAQHLTPHEAALLATVLPSPKKMSVSRPSSYVYQRALDIRKSVWSIGGTYYLKELLR